MTSAMQTYVRAYYGEVLASTDDLRTSACCASGAPPEWIARRLGHVHEEVVARFYGCGFPIPHALEGATVLDLGCGTGRDVFVIAQLVGPSGVVHGVDMTPSQLSVARRTEAWHAERFAFPAPNTCFHHGYIEDLSALGFKAESVDVVVSNCVVNLSPRKDLVLAEAHRILRPGGELYLSDVVADRRLPETVTRDPLLVAECLGGALYRHDFEQLARSVGFHDPRVVTEAEIEIRDPFVSERIGATRFTSVTYRLFKIPTLEGRCEDYGQLAIYRGGIEGAEAVFWLDDHHAFERGRPERVCGNTASMLAETRFAPHFDVSGGRETHFGEFPCGPTLAAADRLGREASAKGAPCC